MKYKRGRRSGSPDVTSAEIAAASARGSVAVRKVERTPPEMAKLVADVEARLRPAAAQLCTEMQSRTCGFHVRLDEKETASNAYASSDGAVVMTAALLHYLETEDEVAFVLGHEIAHQLGDHIEENRQNMRTGGATSAASRARTGG